MGGDSAGKGMAATILGAAAAACWLYLIAFRDGFWRIRHPPVEAPPTLRKIAVVIPARDEATVIARAVSSLLAQRYTGHFHIIIVDDHSSDGTAEADARRRSNAAEPNG